MQSYLGSLEALNDPRNAILKQPKSATHSPRQQLKLKQQKHLESLQKRERAEARRDIEGINVNVSGKCYVIPYQKLKKYPKSLLADPKKRKKYYDFKKNEYFFDHNRSVAESIYNFYQHGELMKPSNIPEQLFADELNFFGVFEYLNEEDKDGLTGLTPPDHLHHEERYNLRRSIWLLLEKPEMNMATRLYNLFSLGIILFSVFLLCIDTFEQGSNAVGSATNSSKPRVKSYRKSQNKNSWIFVSEATCIAFFTLELIARFVVSWNKRQFIKNILNIIDFIAVIPFYISLLLNLSVIGASLSVLRILRLGKIFRVLKISRYTSSLKIIIQTLSSGHRDLWMLFFLLFVQSLFFASVTYYFEQIWAADDTQFTSIPASLWWAFISSLTVGYGDMTPVTSAGKISGAFCAVSGVIVMAPILPIIFDRWTRYYRLSREAKQRQQLQRKYSKGASEHLNVIRVRTGKNQAGFLF